jgi:acetyl esterase/lipase
MPRVYFQVCGLDVNRDDSLIYERVLREECGIPTRVDLYAGFPHCWWDMYPDLEASKKRMEDMIKGVGWLLGKETVPGDGTVAAT